MPITTWLSNQELENYSTVQDKELNDLLHEVRELMPDVYICEYSVVKKPLFGRTIRTTTYEVFHKMLDNTGEVQIMNLPSSNAGYVANYLYGLINGYHKCLKYGNSES